MQTNSLLQTPPILKDIAKSTSLDYQKVHYLFSGKAKKPLVTWEQFLMAHYCTLSNITLNDLETLTKHRENQKTNWYTSTEGDLVTYNEISNNEPLYMLFRKDGRYLHGSAELEDQIEEIKKLLFP